MPEGNGPSFQVHCSGKVAKELKKLQHKASPARRKLIAAAFQKIVNKLRTDAIHAGEPRFHLVSLKMQVRALPSVPWSSNTAFVKTVLSSSFAVENCCTSRARDRGTSLPRLTWVSNGVALSGHPVFFLPMRSRAWLTTFRR